MLASTRWHSAGYSDYFISYQIIRGVNRLPGKTEWAVKLGPGAPLYSRLLYRQARGLAINVAGDAVETHVLGVDEPVFDDNVPKPLLPGWTHGLFEALGISVPYLRPGYWQGSAR